MLNFSKPLRLLHKTTRASFFLPLYNDKSMQSGATGPLSQAPMTAPRAAFASSPSLSCTSLPTLPPVRASPSRRNWPTHVLTSWTSGNGSRGARLHVCSWAKPTPKESSSISASGISESSEVGGTGGFMSSLRRASQVKPQPLGYLQCLVRILQRYAWERMEYWKVEKALNVTCTRERLTGRQMPGSQ